MLPIAVVLAVKELTGAKSRLADAVDDRETLVLAMLADTVAAVREAGITEIAVVTPDDRVTAWARRHRLRHVADHPLHSSLNAAFALGADAVRASTDVAAIALLQPDIPAVSATELSEAFTAALQHRQAMVPDRFATGTTLLVRDRHVAEPTAFGVDSASAHRSAGVVDLDPGGARWPGLRTDVDTIDDLRAAYRLGVGAQTRAWAHARRSAVAGSRDAS